MNYDDMRFWGNKSTTVDDSMWNDGINLDIRGFNGPIVCEDMKDACTVIESLLRRNLSVTAIPKRSFIEEKIYIFYKEIKRSRE